GRGLHGEPALVVFGPEADGFAISRWQTMQLEGPEVKHRAYRAELEFEQACVRKVAAQQVHQQGRNQRAMHDEARVALHLGDVFAVVVNAVAVESERRVAE